MLWFKLYRVNGSPLMYNGRNQAIVLLQLRKSISGRTWEVLWLPLPHLWQIKMEQGQSLFWQRVTLPSAFVADQRRHQCVLGRRLLQPSAGLPQPSDLSGLIPLFVELLLSLPWTVLKMADGVRIFQGLRLCPVVWQFSYRKTVL